MMDRREKLKVGEIEKEIGKDLVEGVLGRGEEMWKKEVLKRMEEMMKRDVEEDEIEG